MKYADYREKLKNTQLVRINDKVFSAARFSEPSEEEQAEGVKSIQILPHYWTLQVSFDGPRGAYNGAENVELGGDATDSDIVAALKAKWDLGPTPWEPIAESVDSPEAAETVDDDPGED